MEKDEEQEDVERVRFWVGRLGEFISGLDGVEGGDPFDFWQNAMGAWQNTAMSDAPPPTSA